MVPDAAGGWRDRDNVSRDLRTVRAGTEFEWFVSHTARRTVATMLDEQVLTARSIADQLGHARVSMTRDVYTGRAPPRADVARRLDTLLDGDVRRDVDPHVDPTPDMRQASDPV